MTSYDELLKRLDDMCGCNIDSSPCGSEYECRTTMQAAARIREQRELLDECEMLISGLECRCDGMNRCARCVTLDKLRGQEKDR